VSAANGKTGALPGSPVDSISDWVTGPLPLNAQIVQHSVREISVGVYMLGQGNGKFHVARVGYVPCPPEKAVMKRIASPPYGPHLGSIVSM
jgi:hypothetical protein